MPSSATSNVTVILTVNVLLGALTAVLVSAGIELIFFPVAAVFWIQYEKNVDNTLMF